MMTRNLILGAAMGGVVGVLETLIFAHWSFANIEMTELLIAVVIGFGAGAMGTVIRLKGASV